MLHLLRIKVSGYRMLSDGTELVLLNHTKVRDEDFDHQIWQLDDHLYTFKTMALVGANSSGKSTVLSLISKVLEFLGTGRFPYASFDFRVPQITIAVDFYLEGKVYSYNAEFGRSANEDRSPYASILSESLFTVPYAPYKGRGILHSKMTDVSASLLTVPLGDTSSIINLTKGQTGYDYLLKPEGFAIYDSRFISSFYSAVKGLDQSIVAAIVKVLDDSLEWVNFLSDNFVSFKRVGQEPMDLPYSAFLSLLSSGTVRGVELFARVYRCLKNGWVFLLDEIECSFHKDLVTLLISLFNDPETNPKGAQLIFTTHFTECLDLLNRQDSIFVCSRNSDVIQVVNLKDGFNVRTDLLKSRQFDNGIFHTNIDYQKRIGLRRSIVNDL